MTAHARVGGPPRGTAAVGRWAIAGVRELVDTTCLPYAALKSFFVERGKGRRALLRTTAYQVYYTAVQPLPLFAFLALLSGVAVTGVCDRLLRGVGLADHVEVVASKAFVRELGPLLLALVLAGRSGPAITTELGSMRVNHEIEALDSLGINIDYHVVLPRILGVTIGALVLTVAMAAVGLAGGHVVGQAVGLVTPAVSLPALLRAVDLPTGAIALGKAAAFGATVATVGSHAGLAVGRAPAEVSIANVRAAVRCYAVCFSLDALASVGAVWGGL